MKRLILFFIIGSAVQAFSQHGPRAHRALADSLYKYHNYKDAAYYYERALRNFADSADIMLRIAKAYSEINNVKESEAWYERAVARNASFSAEDTYVFVKDLVRLERRRDAETVLRNYLEKNPGDGYAASLLEDVRHVEKYFADSAAFTITPLAAINTPAAEFAPVLYGDGLLFTSARPQSVSKRKYHWDKSHFLSLYYAARGTDRQFQKPVVFGKELNSDFHDGPACFYANDRRMILNRNLQGRAIGSSDVHIAHLGLFDAELDTVKNTWRMLPLLFADSTYSFVHPHISADGNTLYFASDKPGGYGGMDLYVSTRHHGEWREPFNLGPVINTPENEVFPYYFDNTLYFASDGHGGLGGLDLFMSKRTPNGFMPPVNPGYPLNSHLDDFSLITRDHQQGYFSSSRSGNDDLFEFHRKVKTIHLLARIYDGFLNASLPGAEIEILTGADDLALTSGSGGHARFDLPDGSAYVLIARKDGKTGMLAGVAGQPADSDHIVHEVALYSDTASVACVGTVKDETGVLQQVAEVHVIDETSGEEVPTAFTRSMVSFRGTRGHSYRVKVRNVQGHVVSETLDVKQEDGRTRTWSMEMKNGAAAQTLDVLVLDEDNREAIAGATVTVTTLGEPDLELTAGETGYVRVVLPRGAAYVVVASRDQSAGMQYGFADGPYHREAKADTVFINGGDGPSVHGILLVTNSRGEPVKDARVTIINDRTGDATSQAVADGISGFFAQPGQAYTIRVERQGYTPVEKKIVTGRRATEKVSVVMREAGPAGHLLAARIFREADHSLVPGADVQVMKFSEDLNLTANEEGMVEFSVPDGEAYILAAKKDALTGLYVGISEKDTGKPPVIHEVTIGNAASDSSYAYAMVTDHTGTALQNVTAEVTDTSTSGNIPAKVENGILSFPAKAGGTYRVAASAENHAPGERTVVTGSSGLPGRLPVIALRKRIPVTVKIGDNDGEVIADAAVVVKDAVTGEEIASEFEEGVLTFTSEQDRSYGITVTHPDYEAASDEIIVPRLAQDVAPRYISMPPKGARSPFLPVAARVLTASDSLPVHEASVKVMSFVTDDLDMVSGQDGRVDFKLPEGAAYIIMATKEDYAGMHTGISGQEGSGAGVVYPVVMQAAPGNRLTLLAMVSDEGGAPPATADAIITDKSTGEKVTALVENGFLAFSVKKGVDYSIEIKAQGYEPATENLRVRTPDEAADPLRITLRSQKEVQLLESLRVVMASDSASVPYAAVKVISFASDDMDLTAGEQGAVEFSLPEGAAYMAVASKDRYFGMYPGVVPEGDHGTAVHTVVLEDGGSDQVPVLGLLLDSLRRPVSPTRVSVTDKQTGEPVEVQVNQGMLVFFGKRGGDYKIEVASDAYDTQVENIRIDPDATDAQEIEISFTRRKLLVLPENSTLVIVHNEVPRIYITAADSHDEIVAEGGMLYLKNDDGRRLLGKGVLKTLLEDPARVFEMTEDQLLTLDNIYFDFNSTFLDESDCRALDKAKMLMAKYPLLQLAVNTHADTRGSARYNLQLTRRRANAVKQYLVKVGVRAPRVKGRAYGKSTPAVICATAACTEEQHERNRRAEFELAMSRKKGLQPLPVTRSQPVVLTNAARSRVSAGYAAMLAKYGHREKEELVFKIGIGAYRLNPTLTFPELADLGEVERQETGGIHYYYLKGFQSMQAAEDVRQQVIMRGVSDAYIEIFYEGSKISFSRFVSITE